MQLCRSYSPMSITRYTTYNFIGHVAPMAVALITIPAYLHVIGEERYGALSLLWIFFGYFGLSDIGLGQATAQRLAQAPSASAAQRAGVVWTALSLSLVLGAGGAALAAPVATWLFGQHFAGVETLGNELRAALPWALLIVPITTVSNVLTGALQAHSLFAPLNLIGIFTNISIFVAPLAFARVVGPQLPGLVCVVLGVRLVSTILLLAACNSWAVQLRGAMIDRAAARQLLKFGGWVTVSATVGPLMVVLDRFVIAVQLGAKSVTRYTVPFQLAERATLLSAALNYALFPRIAAAATQRERLQLSTQALQVLATMTSAPVGLGVLVARPFLAWWISPEMAVEAGLAAQVLCLGFWINSLAMVPLTYLHATGRPDSVAKCHLVELGPYLACLWLAIGEWGLVGAAIAFSARTLVDFVLLSKAAGLLPSGVRLLRWPIVLLLATFVAAPSQAPFTVWRLGAGGALVAALGYWSLTRGKVPLRHAMR